MGRTFVAILLFWTSLVWASYAHAVWAPHDVSILLPLPRVSEDLPHLLKYNSGRGLLPFEHFSTLPPITTDIEEIRLYRDSLRVVAIRIDPCFKESGECKRQVRLVWQPLVKENGEWTTLDAAVHTFYDLSESQWRKIKKEWPQVKAQPNTPNSPLGVHPKILEQGFEGKVWQKMRKKILAHCGPDNLSRITIMTVNPLGNFWAFLGINIKGDQREDIVISKINETSQTFITSLAVTDPTQFVSAMSPAPLGEVGDQEHLKLLRNSSTARDEISEDDLKLAAKVALALENPHIKTTANTDCVSCHISHATANWTLNNFPNWDWETEVPERYPFARGDQVRGANVLRAFGYFNNTAIVSQRVINETEETIKLMR